MLAKSIRSGLEPKASRFIRAVRRAIVTATILIAAVAAQGETIIDRQGALSAKGYRTGPP